MPLKILLEGSINIDLEDSFIAINSDFIDLKLITNFFLFEKEEDNKFVKNEGSFHKNIIKLII